LANEIDCLCGGGTHLKPVQPVFSVFLTITGMLTDKAMGRYCRIP